MMWKSRTRTVVRAITVLAAAGTIATTNAAAQAPMHAEHGSAGARVDPSELRAALNRLLQEHVYLAGAATGAALGGREAEFKAAAGALDANGVDLSKMIGSVYGSGAESAFLSLWRRHIGFAVDYTTGVATKDRKKADAAVNALVNYAQDFAAFLSSANPNLPKAAVADLVKTHVVTLKDVVDAQVAKDQAKTFQALRSAASHMRMIADPLAAAIAKQFPEKFTN
jgi:hypothetical protein